LEGVEEVDEKGPNDELHVVVAVDYDVLKRSDV
jgi:hypothetical protein